jgi:hypothetical protein
MSKGDLKDQENSVRILVSQGDLKDQDQKVQIILEDNIGNLRLMLENVSEVSDSIIDLQDQL